MIAAAIIQTAAYWPGIMTWDAIRQYDQALDGGFDDWHPPAMEWLWRQFALHLQAGPAPMLLLQIALYWAGFGLLARAALNRGRRGLACALAACGLLPIPFGLMGSVLKDCQMEGALLSAVGLIVWSGPDRRWWCRVLVIALLLFASVLRFNAFLAALPLLVAVLPAAWWRTPLRLGAVSVVGTIILMIAMPIANRLVQAEPSGVELSLVIFDLGGITEHSGADAFPPLGVRDPVAVNHRCYTPNKWDSYSWWVDPPCPIGFANVRAALAARGEHPYVVLARAILAHPIAYAEHRLTHFNINSRFLLHQDTDRPVPNESIPNEWGYIVQSNPALRVIDRIAVISAATPLGWPIWWMAVAIGGLILSPRLPSRSIVVPLLLSALLYGLGYLVFSVADEVRYHMWTMTGTLIGIVFLAGDFVTGARAIRARLLWASALPVLVMALCVAWRV